MKTYFKATMLCRLTKDAKINTNTPSGWPVVEMSVVVNNTRFENGVFKDKPVYLYVNAYGKVAERLKNQAERLRNGVGVLVECRLDQYRNRNGELVTIFIADHVVIQDIPQRVWEEIEASKKSAMTDSGDGQEVASDAPIQDNERGDWW